MLKRLSLPLARIRAGNLTVSTLVTVLLPVGGPSIFMSLENTSGAACPADANSCPMTSVSDVRPASGIFPLRSPAGYGCLVFVEPPSFGLPHPATASGDRDVPAMLGLLTHTVLRS